MAIIDRTDGPADDKPSVEVEHGGEIQLPTAPDDKLGRVADPPLVGRRRDKLLPEEIRGNGLVVIAPWPSPSG